MGISRWRTQSLGCFFSQSNKINGIYLGLSSNMLQTVTCDYVFWASQSTRSTTSPCWAICSSSHTHPGLSQPSCLQTLLIHGGEGELEWYVLDLSPSPHTILPNYRDFSFISFLGIPIVGELPTVFFSLHTSVFLLARLCSKPEIQSSLVKSAGACGFTCFPTNSNSNREPLEPSTYRTAKRSTYEHPRHHTQCMGVGRIPQQVPSLYRAGHWSSCHTNHRRKQRMECKRVTLVQVILPGSKAC